MASNIKIQFRKSLAILLSALLLFGCVAIFQSFFGSSHDNHSLMPCCHLSGSAGTFVDHTHNKFVVPETDDLLVITFFALSVSLVWLFFYTNLSQEVFYVHYIRERYGGFKFFEFFINLFRKGILHPKLF